MPVGFEGYAEIDGKLLLTTSISAPLQRNRLESQSGYVGTTSLNSNQGIGYPHIYDFDSYDGSVGFELTKDFLDNNLKPWLFSRSTYKEIRFQTRSNNASNDGLQRLPECYWTSVNLSASEQSAVACSISFMSWYKYKSDAGTNEYTTVIDNYINNKTGWIANNLSELQSGGDIQALNMGQSNLYPIPYWKTSATWTGLNSEVKFTSWNLTINQDISKGFTCRSQSVAQPPEFLIMGVVTCTFDGELVLIGKSNFAQCVVPMQTNVIVNIAGTNINLGVCELDGFDDDLTVSGIVPFGVNYNAYGPIV